ncbi:hypothetical protein NX059_000881 [Plenodomus lindquistii]|nr:hypothetical protein NX059_000881 [Plenodomus lindquistii]
MANIYPSTRPLQDQDIRLVRILPGAWADDIECELHSTSLRNPEPYHALSYVWGSQRVKRPIRLDSVIFHATFNLESALRHLRAQLEDVLLWIDALCIDQGNTQERTHQVKLMGNIYAQCQSVLVYLGDGIGRRDRGITARRFETAPHKTINFSDDISGYPIKKSRELCCKSRPDIMQPTEDLFRFIETLSQAQHLIDVPILIDASTKTERKLLKLFENLRQLMHAPFTPWWGRIWVVQEIALPARVRMICGTVSAPWSMFVQAAERSHHLFQPCCSGIYSALPRDFTKVLKDFARQVEDISILRSEMQEWSPERITQVQTTKQRSLLTLLQRFRGRKASDSRDKVYALLSLVQSKSAKLPLTPDYSITDKEVYLRATVDIIKDSGSLSKLWTDAARKYRKDLPSWVPDWSAPGENGNQARAETTSLYSADCGITFDPGVFKFNGGLLTVDGMCMDTIFFIGDPMLSEDQDTVFKTLKTWLRVTSPLSKQVQFMELICAEVLYSWHDENREQVRRISKEDTTMFSSWASASRASTFKITAIELPNRGSFNRGLFNRFTRFLAQGEMDNDTGYSRLLGELFVTLIPEPEMRALILDSPSIQSVFGRSPGSSEFEAAIDRFPPRLVVLSQRLFTDEDLRYAALCLQRRNDIWKSVPWRLVHNVLEMSLYSQLHDDACMPTEQRRHVTDFDRSMMLATKFRRVFRTDQGRVGLAPVEAAVGDQIFILAGGSTPFVLRRTTDSPGQYWNVIGDCYVRGLMDADIVRESVERMAPQDRQTRPVRLV